MAGQKKLQDRPVELYTPKDFDFRKIRYMSWGALIKFLEIDSANFQRMMKHVPCDNQGRYCLPDVHKFFVKRERLKYEEKLKKINSSSVKLDQEIKEKRIKQIKAQTELNETKLQEFNKTVIPRDVVSRVQIKQAFEIKNFWLTGWKRNIDKILTALDVDSERTNEVLSVVGDFIETMLNDFAKSGRELDEYLEK